MKTKTTFALLAGTAMLVTVLVVPSFVALRQIKKAAEVRKHTSEVILRADDLMSALKDAETGQRGYLLTGDEAFLDSYFKARDSITAQLTELQQRTFISAADKHLGAMAPLMEAKLEEMSNLITLRRNQDMTAVQAGVSGGQGKRLMDSIRAEMSGFSKIEESALEKHEEEFQSNMRYLFTIIVIASLFTLLCALSFAYLISREVQQRLKNLVHLETQHLLTIQEEMNKQLQQANDTLQISEEKLSVTLNSIGDAVIASDAEGRVRILNPLAEELTGWTQAEAFGRPVDEIFHVLNQDTRQPVSIPINEILAHGTILGPDNHTVLIAQDGRECAIADSCALIYDCDSNVVGAVLVFRDVTEENAVQAALRESEAQYRQLFESSRDALIMLLPTTCCFTDANPAALQLFGAATKAEFIILGPVDVSPELQPDGRLSSEKAQEMIATALREDTHSFEWEYRRLNGETFPAEVQLTRMEAKGLVWVQTKVRDISVRKHTDEVLLEAGALQNAIFNSENFSSIATDERGVIQLFNVGAERMLGYTAADVVNKITPADISDPQEVIVRAKALSVELGTSIMPGFEALVFKASRGIEDIYELTYFRKDGSRFPAVVSVTALRDDQGAIIGYLLIGTDNTARKQAEEALLKAGALQNAIFNSEYFSSIATDERGVIQLFNVGAERMLGYTAADVVDKITPADISDPQEVIVRAEALSVELGTPIMPGFEALVFKASRGIEDIYELTYIRKDGSRFPAVVSVTVLRDNQGAIIGYLLIGTDNTARKQAEDALLKAGALQNAIFNSENFSSIATDEKGVIQLFNVGAEHMLGYTAADVVDKITPADISDPQEVIVRAEALSVELGTPIMPGFEALVFKASRGIEDIYELTYIRKDGSRFPAVVSVTVLRDNQGAIIGYLLIGTDNTARKQAEEALLKAGALQNAIFNSENFSSIATDERGVIQLFNVGAEHMLGYTAADVVDKITPADISDPQEVIMRAEALSVELGTPIMPGFEALVFKASRGIEDIYELTYIRKDGSRFPAVVSVTVLRDDQGAIIGYLLIGTDNTARKQVEAEQKLLSQRLHDQQFYTRSLFESNVDALMTTDPLGIITDVNKQMEALTGCTRDELIGAPFKNYFTDPERAEMSVKLVLIQKKITNYELTVCSRDGKETVVSYNATTFYDRDRRLQGMFAAARDVTELKFFEQTLQKNNVELESAKTVAEKANLAKSEFLSSMSHELRSPLNAILGFAQLMESDSPEPTLSQKESIAQILQAGWHLLKLIDEVLDLSKIEARHVPLSQEPVLLAEVMRECQGMIESQAQQHDVSVTFPTFDCPCFVMADRTRVKQVITNLLSNAIKYNRPQGTVAMSWSMSAPGRIHISIKDSGAGLSPEQMVQLFQPFNRLGQESGYEEGTGIGLVVAKRLVELMDGVIGVESVVGEGSVFWFELNSTEAPEFSSEDIEPMAPAIPYVQSGTRLRTLLYVEDNPANMKLVKQLVARRSDLILLTAVNGNSGLELARTAQPAVILMDINMPDISGFDVLKTLREDPVTAHIPVIALSANAMTRDIEKGLQAGFFRYLTKPIKIREFMDTLTVAMEYADQMELRTEELGRVS